MAERRPLILDGSTGRVRVLPTGDTLPGSGGSAVDDFARVPGQWTIPNVPFIKNGSILDGTQACEAGILHYYPVRIGTGPSLTKMAVRSSSVFGGRNVRIGLCVANGDLAPGTLIQDCGVLALAADNTTYSVTLSASPTPGLYHAMLIFENYTEIKCHQASTLVGFGSDFAHIRSLRATQAYGAFPTTLPAWAEQTGAFDPFANSVFYQ